MSYKHQSTDWECRFCHYDNFRKNTSCRQCGRPLLTGSNWYCKGCTYLNDGSGKYCSGCGIDRHVSPQTKKPQEKRTTYNCLYPNNYTELKNEIDRVRRYCKNTLGDCFLLDRYPPHITFMYYGRSFECTPKIKADIIHSVLALPEEDRTIYLGECKILEGRRDTYLVIHIIVPEPLKNLRTILYNKYGIQDKIKEYNPHITLGKIRCLDKPSIPDKIQLNQRTYMIRGIEFN